MKRERGKEEMEREGGKEEMGRELEKGTASVGDRRSPFVGLHSQYGHIKICSNFFSEINW